MNDRQAAPARLWIKLDALLHRNPKAARLSDAEFRAYVTSLCEAKLSRSEGEWPDVEHYRFAVGRRLARHLPALLAAGLLEASDGWIAVHDWSDWQPRDATAAERAKRYRDKKRDERDVTRDVTSTKRDERDVTQSREEESREEESRDARTGAVNNGSPRVDSPTSGDPFEAPETPVLAWLAQHGCDIRIGNRYHQRLVAGVERHGAPAILGMLDRLADAGTHNGDVNGFLFGAIDALDAKSRPKLAEVERSEREDEEERAHQARLEATRRRIAELRGESDGAA
jgi:hypothetical protein